MALPFGRIRAWRAADKHTGIGKIDGFPYLYEHVPSNTGKRRADVYRVEGLIPYPTRPFHRNVYFVPADRLDHFMNEWGEHAEQLVDVRPISLDEALQELDRFRAWAKREKGGV